MRVAGTGFGGMADARVCVGAGPNPQKRRGVKRERGRWCWWTRASERAVCGAEAAAHWLHREGGAKEGNAGMCQAGSPSREALLRRPKQQAGLHGPADWKAGRVSVITVEERNRVNCAHSLTPPAISSLSFRRPPLKVSTCAPHARTGRSEIRHSAGRWVQESTSQPTGQQPADRAASQPASHAYLHLSLDIQDPTRPATHSRAAQRASACRRGRCEEHGGRAGGDRGGGGGT
eukprot:GHVU01169499.1.p1 GENE.GHVU01169499.1~~GHVU01169499.1.p1  ORF type:complete len:233 (+),score=15.16 GHVU01169499.1:484-1182(+)